MPNGTYLYPINGTTLNSMPKVVQFVETVVPISELIVLALTFVAFLVTLQKFGVTRSFAVCSVVGLLTSLTFFLISALTDVWVYGFAVCMAISVILLYFEK